MHRIFFCFCLFAFSSVLPICAQDICEDFRPKGGQLLTPAAVQSELGHAIFQVGSGTAYLVPNGYLITASHVLEAMGSKSGDQVDLTQPEDSKSIHAKVIRILPSVEQDLALLQVTDPSQVSEIRPIDPILHLPNGEETLHGIGYPFIGDANNSTLRPFVATYDALDQGLIEVTQPAFPGDSGGPLIDKYGDVVGTCKQEAGTNNLARYVPMAKALPLFDEIPLSPRMSELDARLLGGQVTKQELAKMLQKHSRSITNLELYVWAKKISKNRSQYSQVLEPYLTCPIAQAFIDRSIPDALYLLISFVSSNSTKIGDAILQMAKRETALGHESAALLIAQKADALYSRAGDTLHEADTRLIISNLLNAQGNFRLSQATLEPLLRKAPKDELTKGHIYSARAGAFAGLGKLKEAESSWSKAIEAYNAAGRIGNGFTPNIALHHAFALSSFADLDVKQGKLDSAAEKLSNALKEYKELNNKKEEASIFFRLGQIELQKGNLVQARENFYNYLTLDPQGVHAPDALALQDLGPSTQIPPH